MAFYISMKEINDLVRIQKERQLATQELSEQLGIDIRNVNLQNIPLCDSVPENHQ